MFKLQGENFMSDKNNTTYTYLFVRGIWGFLFGYDIGIINGALPSIKDTWEITL